MLDAVLALLTGSGAGRVTYDAVARRAGVARQTVYSHFPTRGALLAAAADHARAAAGADDLARAVYEAPTARDALRAFVAVHAAFLPKVLPAYLAVERERSADPDVEAAFAARATGRRQLARLVATRLRAEGDLADPWTVDTATDLVVTVCSGSSTAHLLRGAGWTPEEMHDRLLVLFERALLTPRPLEDP